MSMARSIKLAPRQSTHRQSLRLLSSLLIVLVTLCVIAMAQPQESHPFMNGSFEDGVNPGASFLTLGIGSKSINGWAVTKGTIDHVGTYWKCPCGQRCIDLNGTPGPGAISQTFTTVRGRQYHVAFILGGNGYCGNPLKRVLVKAAGQHSTFDFDTAAGGPWVTKSLSFTANSGSTTLEFESLETPGDCGPAIDSVQVTTEVVPPGCPDASRVSKPALAKERKTEPDRASKPALAKERKTEPVTVSKTVLAQQRTNVEVGKTKFLPLPRQIRQVIRASASAADANIVSAQWDSSQNRFRITGLRPGTTVVTFSGTYRRIISGGIPRTGNVLGDGRRNDVPPSIREANVPFEYTYSVTVLPPGKDERVIPVNYEVTRGLTRSAQLTIFLGPTFSRENERGVEWRNVRAVSSDGNIASVSIDSNRQGRMMAHITGVNGGRARIIFSGERRLGNSWQQVVRYLRVKVSPGGKPSESAGADPLLDGLLRRYAELKPSVDRGVRGELSVDQKAEVRLSLENLGTLVANGIRNLEAATDRSGERLARRRTLLGDIQSALRRLQRDQAGGEKLPDLNGEWMGEGYNCEGPQPPERIRIEHVGNTVTAIKRTGDRCLAAGQVTFRGTFTKNPFPAELQAGLPGQSKYFVNITVDVASPDLIKLSAGVVLRRASPTTKNVPDHLYKVSDEVAPKDPLAIRSAPGVSNRQIGSIPAGATNIVGLEERQVEGRRWVKVNFRGVVGWVNKWFLISQEQRR